MSDANITVLDDNSLLEIFERLPLVDQIRASKVCSRWRAMCQRFVRRVYEFSGDGRTWRFNEKDGTILTATADSGIVKTVMASCSRYIQKLKVNGEQIPSDSRACQLIMSFTTARCRHLRRIELELLRDVIILTFIPTIIQRNKNLKSLKLNGIYGWNLHDIVQHLPERLYEFQILNLTPTDLNILVPVLISCGRLGSFGCDYVPDMIAELIGSQKQLKNLRLHYAFTIPESFNHIAQLKNLVYLDMEKSVHMNDENLVNIAHNCQQLQGLVISSSTEITDIGISNLANLERLKILRIRDLNYITDASIAILPVSLQGLCCCRCERILDNGVIRFLTRATNLQILCISGSQITNITIEAAIRIVRDQGSSRKLNIYAENSRADLDTIDETVIAELPPLLHLDL